MELEHIWESVFYMSNGFLELRMRISPPATWFDGFFVDVGLMISLPVSPETRKDEWIREYIIYHESPQIPSCLTLRIHRDIVLHLSLDVYQTALKYGSWIHLFECCSYPNSAIYSTRDDICIPHMIPEEFEILCNILFLLSIPYAEPDYFLSHVRVVDKQYPLWSVFAFGEPISIDHDMMYIWIYFTDTGNRVLIKTRLDILTDSIFIEFFLISQLIRWVSRSDIFFEELLFITREIFLFSFFTSNETKETLFALQFRTSALIFPIFLQLKRSTFRAFFLA